MAWEVLAIWAIVAATIIWFVRDERRERLARLEARARQYAVGGAWRHRSATPARPLAMRTSEQLTAIQRQYHSELQRRRR